MESTIGVTGWFVSILIWQWYAPVWSAFTRNVCAIMICIADVVLFFVLLRYWKVSLIFPVIGAGVYWLMELFPRNQEKLSQRRDKVTFLQDILFCAGGFWLGVQMMLVGVQGR